MGETRSGGWRSVPERSHAGHRARATAGAHLSRWLAAAAVRTGVAVVVLWSRNGCAVTVAVGCRYGLIARGLRPPAHGCVLTSVGSGPVCCGWSPRRRGRGRPTGARHRAPRLPAPRRVRGQRPQRSSVVSGRRRRTWRCAWRRTWSRRRSRTRCRSQPPHPVVVPGAVGRGRTWSWCAAPSAGPYVVVVACCRVSPGAAGSGLRGVRRGQWRTPGGWGASGQAPSTVAGSRPSSTALAPAWKRELAPSSRVISATYLR